MPLSAVRLKPSVFAERFELNRKYVSSMTADNLLHSHYMEAGLWQPLAKPQDYESIHMGWEAPTSQVRGMFAGHWLSAAARIYATNGDIELKARLDHVVAELARCQQENGGEWVASIPEKYLNWIARGKDVWAPHYVVHKSLMGLFDAYQYAGNTQALAVLEKQADWFVRWTPQFTREQMDNMLDYETGGMLETWANLYGVTRKPEHLALLECYSRPRLFDRLLAGEDALTNRHANTTIPEAQGAARAYEVTGDERWRKIAEAYWYWAVTARGAFCTGGQTSGEVWTPPFALSARLGDRTQEHCVVYNMTRLADYLFRWTGDVTYADYIERNLYNGTLAQQNPQTGMVTYFLPLRPGGHKHWGTRTHDFWCCHGTLVQAHTTHNAYVYYGDGEGLVVTQYIPTELRWEWDGVPVTLTQAFDAEASTINSFKLGGAAHRPSRWLIDLRLSAAQPTEFTLKLRLPWWLAGEAALTVNGEPYPISGGAPSFVTIRRVWHDDHLQLELPKALTTCPLPDDPETVAFMDGPVVLAGLVDEERALNGDPNVAEAILTPDYEREWGAWKPGYRTRGQDRNFRLIPLHEITDEAYTVYFPLRPPKT
jgi:DUF1680 family protein